MRSRRDLAGILRVRAKHLREQTESQRGVDLIVLRAAACDLDLVADAVEHRCEVHDCDATEPCKQRDCPHCGQWRQTPPCDTRPHTAKPTRGEP